MSVYQLKSGRWRAQAHNPATGRQQHIGTYATKREAKAAREEARKQFVRTPGTTVSEFRARWLSDPLFARPKESTRRHNAERTKAFAEAHASVPIGQVGDEHVEAWLRDPRRVGTVPALRAMFNDAASAKAGRLVRVNPFSKLGLSKSKGNANNEPPPEETVRALIAKAHELSGPYFGAWLEVAAYTGMRPGELDALKWPSVDFDASRIRVREQFSAGSGGFTRPKNGEMRDAPLTLQARDALLALPRTDGFCFLNNRNAHFTPGARAYHWKAVKAAVGYTGTLYLATRHFAGWYMVNVLDLLSEDVAIALGHTDGGELVRRLYGHRDRDRALDRVTAAYASVGNVVPLRAVKEA